MLQPAPRDIASKPVGRVMARSGEFASQNSNDHRQLRAECKELAAMSACWSSFAQSVAWRTGLESPHCGLHTCHWPAQGSLIVPAPCRQATLAGAADAAPAAGWAGVLRARAPAAQTTRRTVCRRGSSRLRGVPHLPHLCTAAPAADCCWRGCPICPSLHGSCWLAGPLQMSVTLITLVLSSLVGHNVA